MTRSPPTWFGFTLTPKQAISLFVLALFGFLICIFVFIMSGISIYMNFYYYFSEPYYYDDSYYTYMVISQFIPSIFFFVIFIICCYTMSCCRKTAKYYQKYNAPSQNQPQNQIYVPRAQPRKMIKETPMYNDTLFCPNCGKKHAESHQFCTNCGYELI
jgi:predicted membrane protein